MYIVKVSDFLSPADGTNAGWKTFSCVLSLNRATILKLHCHFVPTTSKTIQMSKSTKAKRKKQCHYVSYKTRSNTKAEAVTWQGIFKQKCQTWLLFKGKTVAYLIPEGKSDVLISFSEFLKR